MGEWTKKAQRNSVKINWLASTRPVAPRGGLHLEGGVELGHGGLEVVVVEAGNGLVSADEGSRPVVASAQVSGEGGGAAQQIHDDSNLGVPAHG